MDFLDYHTLDKIADSYTPLLAIAALSALVNGYKRSKLTLLADWLFVLCALAWAYGWMFIDIWLAIWPALGMDYSTHTAVSLVLVIYLCFTYPDYRWGWIGSMLLYMGLMRYQEYHSFADMLTTACVMLPSIPVYKFITFYSSFHIANRY